MNKKAIVYLSLLSALVVLFFVNYVYGGAWVQRAALRQTHAAWQHLDNCNPTPPQIRRGIFGGKVSVSADHGMMATVRSTHTEERIFYLLPSKTYVTGVIAEEYEDRSQQKH
jgi:hypothetical protein